MGLLLISPAVLLFSAPLAIGIWGNIVHQIGSGPAVLGSSAAVAIFALYKLHHHC
jgi:hypothetical protein